VTASVYDEAMPMLFASRMAYTFTEILSLARREKIKLEIPEEFKNKDLERFLEESVDMTEFNNGNGLSFDAIIKLLDYNQDVLRMAYPDEQSYERQAINWFRENAGTDQTKKVFLAYLRSIQSNVACVYSIFKDTFNKRIIVSFRGSSGFVFSTRDWQTNLNAFAVGLRTPPLVANEMREELQKRVLVHRGFYNYLFNNKRMDGEQRYDKIIADIQSLIEPGYSVCATGHSLGGALATMFSLKIAGCGKNRDWLPRPITCVSVAAPISGTAGYRAAAEQLERHGLLRHLRINNGEDIIPAIPNLSLFPWRPMKHIGMNLRLTRSGFHIEHTSLANVWTSIRNSIFKPIWFLLRWHGVPLHDTRMNNNVEELKNLTLDDLYRNEKYVSKDFIDGILFN
jgi:predicted lipase